MRLPRFRFTVRRMMIVVAVVAVLLGLGVWANRLRDQSRIYQQRSYEYAEIELFSDPTHIFSATEGGREENRRQVKQTREWARTLREKYAHAARNPWITLEPDPPEPR